MERGSAPQRSRKELSMNTDAKVLVFLINVFDLDDWEDTEH